MSVGDSVSSLVISLSHFCLVNTQLLSFLGNVTNTHLFLTRADSSECLSGPQSPNFSRTFQVSVSHEGGAYWIPNI